MLTAAQWQPVAPAGPPMRLPASEVFIHHTVTNPTNDPLADFRTVDRISQQRFGRRTYSWIVHPSGQVAEYAGTTIGAHTKGHNSTGVAISFIGNFEHDTPTPAALDAARWLIESQTAAGVIAPGAPIQPHSAVYATACPGRNLRAAIPTLTQPPEDDVNVQELNEALTPMARKVDQIVVEVRDLDGKLNKALTPMAKKVDQILLSVGKLSVIAAGSDPDATRDVLVELGKNLAALKDS